MRTNWYQGYERSSGWQRRSMFDDLLENENALIYIIIALNVLIFIIWNTYGMNMLLMSFPFSILNTPAAGTSREGRRTMARHFLVSRSNVLAGRFHRFIVSPCC